MSPGALWLPPVLMASSQLAVGGWPARRFQCVLQAEKWLLWVLACSFRGPGTGPMSPHLASDSGTPARPLAVRGACVSSHIRATTPFLRCPVLDPVASNLPVLFSDQNFGIGAALSDQTS